MNNVLSISFNNVELQSKLQKNALYVHELICNFCAVAFYPIGKILEAVDGGTEIFSK